MTVPNDIGTAGIDPRDFGSTSDRVADRTAVLLPAAITLGICLVGIEGRQPWQDEHATWIAATRTMVGFERLIQHVDVVLAPYYFLMRGYAACFGDSIVGMRVPSALAMGASAAMVSALGRRLFDRRTGLLASLIFAFLPVVSRYGQEARPSALATFAVLLSTFLFLRAFHETAALRFRRCAGYAVSITLVGALHLVALTALAAHAVSLLAFQRARPWVSLRVPRERVTAFVVAMLAGLAGVTPMIVLGRGQTAQLRLVDLRLTTVFPMYWQLFQPHFVGCLLILGAIAGMTRATAFTGH